MVSNTKKFWTFLRLKIKLLLVQPAFQRSVSMMQSFKIKRSEIQRGVKDCYFILPYFIHTPRGRFVTTCHATVMHIRIISNLFGIKFSLFFPKILQLFCAKFCLFIIICNFSPVKFLAFLLLILQPISQYLGNLICDWTLVKSWYIFSHNFATFYRNSWSFCYNVIIGLS